MGGRRRSFRIINSLAETALQCPNWMRTLGVDAGDEDEDDLLLRGDPDDIQQFVAEVSRMGKGGEFPASQKGEGGGGRWGGMAFVCIWGHQSISQSIYPSMSLDPAVPPSVSQSSVCLPL